MFNRRFFLGTASAALGAAPLAGQAAPAGIGPAQPFDLQRLKDRARDLANQPWQAPAPLPQPLAALHRDAYRAIRFRPEKALGVDEGAKLQVRLLHLGGLGGSVRRRVRLHELRNGMAQEIAYDPALYDYGDSGLDGSRLPRDTGFAGLAIAAAAAPRQTLVAFLGGTAFRAVGGSSRQRGLSARGLSLNPAGSGEEEFPDFTQFWIEQGDPRSPTLVVYALLDSPSAAGAYRFAITPGDTTVMEVEATLYPRTELERIGIAPCASMYLSGENSRRVDNDWRPEVHDSDGLSMWTGAGKWIWRPLHNPLQTRYNGFVDNNPRGFGLLQRDRNFDHYQDDEALFDRRPSLWVEPTSAWGAGQVQLIEIPTDNEGYDNVLAFWRPAQKPRAGLERGFSYRLHWGAEPPAKTTLARCTATRAAITTQIDGVRPRYARRFVVDFVGGRLPPAEGMLAIEATATASRNAAITGVATRLLPGGRGWRAQFDVEPTDGGTDPINLRLFLRGDGQPLSETWVYEWSPPPAALRG